jgi:anti-sigma regulatory factor (Ser/Thr protein kinase)
MLNFLSVRGRDRTQGDKDDVQARMRAFAMPMFGGDKAGGMSEGMTARTPPRLKVAEPVAGREFSRTYPARPEQVGHARAFVRGVLPDDPVADDVLLAVSELATNAISHSRSREPGGLFTVRVLLRPGCDLRVEVADAGGPWDDGNGDTEHGRGLVVVAGLAGEANWGVTGGLGARTFWVRFDWPRAVHYETWPAEPVTTQSGCRHA